jgi:prevent-host-death family protein
MTTEINTAEAKEQFTDLVNRVALNKERIILTRRGKEIAAIIPAEDLQLLQANQDKQDVREATDALKESRDSGTATLDEVLKEIGDL